MLVIAHIHINVIVGNPADGRFQITLTIHFARDIFACQAVCRAVVLAEIAFGVAHPRTRIHRVAQFLFGEFLSRDVDGLEPFQLLAVGAATDVDLQLVIEDLLLFVGLEVMEIAEHEGEVAVDILANADGALLAVDDFVGAIFAHGPIHHIEREALRERVDDGIALFFLVDEFTLERRAHIEFAAVGAYAVFVVVLIAVGQLADGDFVEFYVHCFCCLYLSVSICLCLPIGVLPEAAHRVNIVTPFQGLIVHFRSRAWPIAR